jgi:hypothetical protein
MMSPSPHGADHDGQLMIGASGDGQLMITAILAQ